MMISTRLTAIEDLTLICQHRVAMFCDGGMWDVSTCPIESSRTQQIKEKLPRVRIVGLVVMWKYLVGYDVAI